MPNFHEKDVSELAYSANKKMLRAKGSIILDAVMNAAIGQMTRDFNAATNRGEILRIEGTRAELMEYMRAASRNVLEAGEVVAGTVED